MDENGPKKSVWASVPDCHATTSLSDVMSEQLADHLEVKDCEARRSTKQEVEDAALAAALAASEQGPPDKTCSDDLMIAQMLQMQFDNEHDSVIRNEERVFNKGSKVSVSYQKYKVVPEDSIWQDSDDEDKELAEYLAMDDRKRNWDCYEAADKQTGQMPRCGYKKTDNGIITKHDKEINHRTNGKRIMSIPKALCTGDGGGCDMQISNSVYNQLKKFAWKEDRRKEGRVHDKDEKSTADQAVDPATRLLLFKMVNNGILETVNGVISTGKEAVILHAEGGPGPADAEEPMNIPKECVLKVFKTTLNEFKTREKYIKDDYRFRSRFSKQNPRKIIHMWAEKEMRNLTKMARFGINVPEAIMLKKHVLLMSFIGQNGEAAPKLRDVEFAYADLELVYLQVVDMMTKLYRECHLVHADLSEYNILWHNEQVYFIDVSQSVEPNHPCGLEFLYRDCTNVADFFRRRGLVSGKSPWRLFTDITDLPLGGDDDDCPQSEAEILARILDFEKSSEILTLGCAARCDDDMTVNQEDEDLVVTSGGNMMSVKHYPFDYCWDKVKESKASPMPIPGHPKAKGGGRGGKSPKSPSTLTMAAKSPKSPKSGGVSLASMTDQQLQELKADLSTPLQEGKSSKQQVKFEEDA